MAFGKHAFKVITLFVVLFLVGLVIKLFDNNSLENYENNNKPALPPDYSLDMSLAEFKNYVNQYINGDIQKLNNIPDNLFKLLKKEHQDVIKKMRMQSS